MSHSPGSAVFHPAGEVHHGIIGGGGGHCLNLEIGEPFVRDERRLPASPTSSASREIAWLSIRLYREFTEWEEPSPLILEGLTLEILGHLLRMETTRSAMPPIWVARVADRVHDELAAPLTVRQLADDAGVSPVRLSREFRRAYAEGIGEMHRRLRVEAAGRALLEPDAGIVDVALALGFSDQSHLTRVFRRVTGVTPGEYRRLRGVGAEPPTRVEG